MAALLGLCAVLPTAHAGKPGGGGSASPAGTITFTHYTAVSAATIRPDGTELRTLAVTACDAPWRTIGNPLSGSISASHLRHGGKLWYVRVCSPADGPASYPNGNARRELFLVREDDHAVQLTHDALLAPVQLGRPDFSVDDGSVLFGGYRWVQDGAGDWVPGESGVFAADLDWSDVDHPILVGAPVLVVGVESVLTVNGLRRVDVSPPQRSADGRTVVFAHQSAIHVVDPVAGTTRTVGTGEQPRLSPSGERIAYQSDDGIRVCNTDGTGNVLAIADKSGAATLSGTLAQSPIWSPDSTQIAFLFTQFRSSTSTQSLRYAPATANAAAKTVPNATDIGVVQSWVP